MDQGEDSMEAEEVKHLLDRLHDGLLLHKNRDDIAQLRGWFDALLASNAALTSERQKAGEELEGLSATLKEFEVSLEKRMGELEAARKRITELESQLTHKGE
jgi:hypothetical protein